MDEATTKRWLESSWTQECSGQVNLSWIFRWACVFLCLFSGWLSENSGCKEVDGSWFWKTRLAKFERMWWPHRMHQWTLFRMRILWKWRWEGEKGGGSRDGGFSAGDETVLRVGWKRFRIQKLIKIPHKWHNSRTLEFCGDFFPQFSASFSRRNHQKTLCRTY